MRSYTEFAYFVCVLIEKMGFLLIIKYKESIIIWDGICRSLIKERW